MSSRLLPRTRKRGSGRHRAFGHRIWGPGLALAILLAGCGFQPLHGKRERAGSTATDLAYVAVSPIPDRSGQLLRNNLIELFNDARIDVSPVYRLDVRLDEKREGLQVDRDDSISRFNLRSTAKFRLTDTRTNQVVFRGQVRSIAAYNTVRSDYANLIAERDARRRSADNLAHEIKTRLAIYFSRLDD